MLCQIFILLLSAIISVIRPSVLEQRHIVNAVFCSLPKLSLLQECFKKAWGIKRCSRVLFTDLPTRPYLYGN